MNSSLLGIFIFNIVLFSKLGSTIPSTKLRFKINVLKKVFPVIRPFKKKISFQN